MTSAPRAQGSSIRIVGVRDCHGRRWAASPALRTVYYLATLPPVEIAEAIMDAVTALAEHDSRPKLRLVHSTRIAAEAAARDGRSVG